MDKKTKSSRLGSYRSHDKRGITMRNITFGRNNHHSPIHSTRRVCSSSTLVKKPKKTGVDELLGEMNKIKPPTFEGEHKKDEDEETWILNMRKYFEFHNYSSTQKE
jgi:hypothetical protein